MSDWALVFFEIFMVCGFVGFNNKATFFSNCAQLAFVIFLAFFIIALIRDLLNRHKA